MAKDKKVEPDFTRVNQIWSQVRSNAPPKKPVEDKEWYKNDSTEDPLKKLNDDLIKKIAIAEKIKAARLAGAITEEHAKQLRIDAGLETPEEKEDKEDEISTENIQMLQLLREAKTPEERQLILQTMMGKKGGNSNIMMLASMMGQVPREKSMLERVMEEKLIKDLSGDGKKSDMEQFKDFLHTFKELNSTMGNDGSKSGIEQIAKEISTAKEALTAMGIVQVPTGGAEEMKLDIELRKLEMEKELRMEEIKGKSANDQMIANAIKSGATALVTALPEILGGKGGAGGSPESKVQSPPPAGRGINCIGQGCGAFMPVKLNEKYNFDCPKCNKHYISQGDGTVNEIILEDQHTEEGHGQTETEENSA